MYALSHAAGQPIWRPRHIHLAVNHKPWQAVSFCYWNNTSRHKETDTCYDSDWRARLSLSVPLPHAPIIFLALPHIFPPFFFSYHYLSFQAVGFVVAVIFFHVLIYWMPWFKQWVCVYTRASFFHSCIETQTSCVSSMWTIVVLCEWLSICLFCILCVCFFRNNQTEARVHHLWL